MGTFSRAMRKVVGGRVGRIAKSWNYDAKADLIVPPVVEDIDGDGKPEIIIGTTKGDLIVLDAQAQERWRYGVHEQMGKVDEMFLDQEVINSINAAPVVADLTGDGRKSVIFGSEAGILYCLDAQGGLTWKYNTQGGIRGGVLVEDINGDGKPEIVFGSTDNNLYLLDTQGKLLEKFEQEAPIGSTPGFHEGLLVFGTEEGLIVAITPKGEPRWTHKTEAKVTAAPAFAQLIPGGPHYVIIGSTDNNLYCLDVDGELVWTYKTQGAIYSQAAIADLDGDKKLEIVVGSCDNNVHAVTHDGERFWTYETDFWVMGTPIIMDIDGDGRLEVIAGSYDHYLYVLDSKGAYLLDYVPGLSGVVQQAGHYSEIMTQEPGQHVGKKLWQYKTEGVIVGCTKLEGGRGVIVTTKTGVVDDITHRE